MRAVPDDVASGHQQQVQQEAWLWAGCLLGLWAWRPSLASPLLEQVS